MKSTAIRSLDRARVDPAGLADDRRWMVVDDRGEMVSARTDRALFTITARTPALDGVAADLVLEAGGRTLAVAHPSGPTRRCRIHGSEVDAVPAGPEADAWVGEVLGRDDVSLVWCPDPTRRGLSPAHSRPGDHTAFADGYPVLLATQASLDQLNTWIAETAQERGEPPVPLPMARFRPNLVLDGDLPPFDEDRWSRVTIAGIGFRVAKPCARCVMTTVDPVTLARAPEPLRTLARHRKVGSKTLFATNLIPDGSGTLRIGDQATIER